MGPNPNSRISGLGFTGNTYDGRLDFARKREQAVDELVALAKPLGGEGGKREVDERSAALLGQRLGKHRLSTAWVAVQEHTAGRREERAARSKELGVRQRVDDGLAERVDDLVQSTDGLESGVNRLGRDNLASDRRLVLVEVEGRQLFLGQSGLRQERFALLFALLACAGCVGKRRQDVPQRVVERYLRRSEECHWLSAASHEALAYRP